MKNIGIKLAAVTFLALFTATPAVAGKGGSAAKIEAAVASRSVDAIIAEVERAEALMCNECIDVMTRLTADSRYEVREVAAWWFAKRPTLMRVMVEQFTTELLSGSSIEARNAADFLGGTRHVKALPTLQTAIGRAELDAAAKRAIVGAVKQLGTTKGNAILAVAMTDADAGVRAAAARAYRDLRGQTDGAPVAGLLSDADATVRAEAATVMGGLVYAGATAKLEALVVSDPSPIVRKNAAWALGKIGSASSRAALTQASNDPSSYVKLTARAALSQLR